MKVSTKHLFKENAQTYLIIRYANGDSRKRYALKNKSYDDGIAKLEQLLCSSSGWLSAEMYDNQNNKSAVLWYYKNTSGATRLSKEEYYVTTSQVKTKKFNAYIIPTLAYKIRTGNEKGRTETVEDIATIVCNGKLDKLLSADVQKILLYPIESNTNTPQYEVIASSQSFVRCATGEVIALPELKQRLLANSIQQQTHSNAIV